MKLWNSFIFKIYITGPTEINLYGIAHAKLDIIARQKIYTLQQWFLISLVSLPFLGTLEKEITLK